MNILYTISIILYSAGIRIASVFNQKAGQWIKGRRGWRKNLISGLSGSTRKLIWFHCASLGEFEQGRPVIESVKEKYPEFQILLTFFSPSGYEVRKNWDGVDYIFYLPADTVSNARRFVEITQPSMVFFVKYEFWNNFISAIHRKGTPLYLISGIFRPQQYFFRWYGGFFRNLIRKFTHIYVQDEESFRLLQQIGIKESTIAGDTRFDRVKKIASAATSLPLIEAFCAEEKVAVAGSSWPQDEELIIKYINEHPGKIKWIIAPHEISKSNIERIESQIKVKSTRYSDKGADISVARVMIIDNIGILSSVYRYAVVAVIGGGFGKGIHNILEAACWGLPVLFGPNYEKFREAVDMLKLKAAYSFKDYNKFSDLLDSLLDNSEVYSDASREASKYVEANAGATQKIVTEAFR